MSDPMEMDRLIEAHSRAIVAMMNATNATEEQADELVTAITALVFETFNQYLSGADTCN